MQPVRDTAVEQTYAAAYKTRPAGLYVEAEQKAHAGDLDQSVGLFRALLELEPNNLGAEVGLAHAFSALKCYPEASYYFDRALNQSPANYGALQGRAFLLLWEGHDRRAKAMFQELARRRPGDRANSRALAAIARSEDLQRWRAMRPTPGGPLTEALSYDISFLAGYPEDARALRDLIRVSSALKDYTVAIQALQRALQASPGNIEFQTELASVLAWDRQYSSAAALDERVLDESPNDLEALKKLAQVYDWSGRLKRSLALEKKLVALKPRSLQDRLTVATLEIRLKDSQTASKSLQDILNIDPGNRAALLDLAQLELKDGKLQEAGKSYEAILGENFTDADALYGAARIDYYLGHPRHAQPLAARLVSERPKDFDALMLLARINRALNKRKLALAFLNRAARLSPHNTGVTQLRSAMRAESSITVHTSASYAREVSASANPALAPLGAPTENLNTYGSATRIGFTLFPQSHSYVEAAFVPSNSPLGGIRGAVAPAEYLYGQTTRLTSWLTLRGGLGMVRMGPGKIFLPGNKPTSIQTVGVTPLGFAGFSISPTHQLSLDFTVSHNALLYTPTTVRYGVTRTRLKAGVTYRPDGRTSFRASFFHDRLASSAYHYAYSLPGSGPIEMNGNDWGNGAKWAVNRSLIRSRRFSFHLGYAGLAFGYAGLKRGVFMGFFDPAFYQNHFVTTLFSGFLWGPMDYSLMADFGVQQTGESQPFSRAEQIGPGITLRLNRSLSLALGYIHYNFAQSLGNIRGNAIQVSTSYRF